MLKWPSSRYLFGLIQVGVVKIGNGLEESSFIALEADSNGK